LDKTPYSCLYKILLYFIFLFTLADNLYSKTIPATHIQYQNLTMISQNMMEQIVQIDKPYTDKSINDAMKKLYKLGYFTNITATYDSHKNAIVFIFSEKYSIVNLELKGYKTKEEDKKKLFETMELKKGNLYDEAKIKKAKEILLAILRSEGYYDSVANVDVKLIPNKGYDVTFNVNRGYEIVIKKVNYNLDNKSSLLDIEDVVFNKEQDLFPWLYGQNDGILKAALLPKDEFEILNLYRQNGYLDAQIKSSFGVVDFSTFEASLNYDIKANKQYEVSNVVFSYDKNLFKHLFADFKLSLKAGRVFNIDNMRKDVKAIKDMAATKGYIYADVQYDLNKDESTNKVEIVYKLFAHQKVYINDVIIKGNTKTLDSVIRRWVYLASGDLFDKSEMIESIHKLKRSGYFSDVKITPQKISSDKVNLIVEVTEARTGSLKGSGGYGNTDGLFFSLEVSDSNFLGSGINTALSTTYSIRTRKFIFSLSNPSIRDSVYSGSLRVYNTKTTDRITDEVDSESGVSVGGGRSIGRHINVGAVYSYELRSTTENITEFDMDNNKTYLVSAIKPYINFDNTDDFYTPRSGIKAGASMKIAGVGGDVSYVHNYGRFATYYGLKELTNFDIILQYKAKINAINKGVGIYPRLYLGGPKSVRGYIANAFGSENRFNKNFYQRAEVNFPLVDKIGMRFQLFYDYGVIGDGNWESMNIEAKSYGVNLSWRSPLGPINFIFGTALDNKDNKYHENFSFDIGY